MIGIVHTDLTTEHTAALSILHPAMMKALRIDGATVTLDGTVLEGK